MSIEDLTRIRTEHPIDPLAQQRIFTERRIVVQKRLRFLPRALHKLQITCEISDLEHGQAMLPLSEKVTRAALRQISLGDLKAVVRSAQDFEPLSGLFPLICAEADAV